MRVNEKQRVKETEKNEKRKFFNIDVVCNIAATVAAAATTVPKVLLLCCICH